MKAATKVAEVRAAGQEVKQAAGSLEVPRVVIWVPVVVTWEAPVVEKVAVELR